MMNRQGATEMQQYGLKAIENLVRLLDTARESCSNELYEQLRRGVGLSIGRIQIELLDFIYSEYPELDDLR